MKPNRFLLSCFVFSRVFHDSIRTGNTITETQQKTALDFEALLAAIKQADTPLKSGEGVVVHISGEPSLDIDPRIVTLRMVFDSENTRFDSPRRTTILTPTIMWGIVRNRKPNYYFSTKPQSHHEHMDPRRFLTWVDKDLAIHLRENDFHIIGREVFNGTLCYVLEAKQGKKSEKIWIAPEQGFRYLKHESQQPTPVDALDSDIPMEALTIFRTIISYQQHGEIWFPKAVFIEYAWLDFKPADPIISPTDAGNKELQVESRPTTRDIHC